MNLINYLKGLFKPKFQGVKYPVKYAFTSGGTDYYELDDVFNLPYKRGLKAFSVYEELRMKCDKEYLVAFTEAIDNVFAQTKFGMKEAMYIQKINAQMKERLKYALPEDLCYKLAAVVFFDKTESPLVYDADYCAQKIAHWKKHSANDFFLQLPVVKLIPFLNESDANFQTYFQVTEELNKAHLEAISTRLSGEQKQQLKKSALTSSVKESHANSPT